MWAWSFFLTEFRNQFMIRRCHVHEPSQFFKVFRLGCLVRISMECSGAKVRQSSVTNAGQSKITSNGKEHLSWAANHDHVFRIEGLLHGIERQCVGGVFLVGNDVVDLGEARHESSGGIHSLLVVGLL